MARPVAHEGRGPSVGAGEGALPAQGEGGVSTCGCAMHDMDLAMWHGRCPEGERAHHSDGRRTSALQ